MGINQNNWLDLPNLFFNELVGDVWLGYFIGLGVIIWFGIKSNVGSHALFGFSILWSFAVVAYQTNELVLAVIGLLVAFIYYGVMSKFMTR